jgi:hypothetical protein
MATVNARNARFAPVALTGALILLAAAMLAPGLIVGPSLDAAVFSHIGRLILDGVAPYAGSWDHKPPGIYLASAGVQAVLSWLGAWTAGWLLSVATSVGIGLAVATVLERLDVTGRPRALAACGATIFASQYFMALGGGLTEPLATLLAAWAFVLALRQSTAMRLAGIGVLVGLSTIVSLQLLPGGAVVCGFALVQTTGRSRRRGAGILALGVAVPLLVATAWLFVIGALPAAVDAIVGYSGAYRASSNNYGATLGAPVAAWTALASLFLVAPALLGAMSVMRARQPRRALVIASLAWIGASLVLFVAQGRFYAHYVIPLAVPIGILAGVGLDRLGAALSAVEPCARKAVGVLPLTLALVVSVLAGIVSAAMEIAPVADAHARIAAVAQQLRDVPAGTMLVWGNQPGLYDVADRAPAIRYSYLYPLTTRRYSTPALIDAVARALADHPPAVVVDAGSNAPGQPGFLPLLIDRPIATDGRDLDLLDPLRAFVASRYRLAATIAGWPIYVLR